MITEGFAFFYWHRHKFTTMVTCPSSGNPRSLCRKAFAYRWSLT